MRRELLEEIELDLPMKLWKVEAYPLERYFYVGRIDRALHEITLHEGQALDYFGLEDLDRLKIGFDLERVFREAFAALVDGTLPLE